MDLSHLSLEKLLTAAGIVTTVAGAFFTIVFFLPRQFVPAYRLVSRTLFAELSNHWLRSILLLLGLLARHLVNAKFGLAHGPSFFQAVRVYVEKRFCVDLPRPWFEAYEVEKIPHIAISTCDKLYKQKDEIKVYFEALGAIGSDKGARDERYAQEFVCPVEIKKGFIAPIHFLAGSLHQFDEKWETIIDDYEKQVKLLPANKHSPGDAWKRAWNMLLPLKTFSFDCWLLWGPSIPVCNAIGPGARVCTMWSGKNSVLQYGYGDENNSVELYADSKRLSDVFASISGTKENDGNLGPIAFEAMASGKLKYSKFVRAQEAKDTKGTAAVMVRALESSWDTDADRLILDVTAGSIGSGNSRNNYYSGYIWVMFAVLDSHTNPIEAGAGSGWKNLFPFFVHGNLADGGTYDFLKRQLAHTAVSSIVRVIAEFVADNNQLEYPLRFAFACAFDEANCSMPSAYPQCYDESKLLRYYLTQELKDAMASAKSGEIDPVMSELDKFILLDHYNGSDGPYAACSLPQQLSVYYEQAKKIKA